MFIVYVLMYGDHKEWKLEKQMRHCMGVGGWGWVDGGGMQEKINKSERRVSNIGRRKGEGDFVRWYWDGIGHSITLTTAIPPCKSRFESP